MICFHGYTSQGLADYGSISNYYLKRGYNVLLVDQRSHGQSEGKYIGFGCKDRYDAYRWIEWVIGQEGENVQILLHGNSMGGATVLMASGLDLPQQVKGIIADCPFTSPKAVFTHVLHSMYHLPAFPIIQIADAVNKKQAGYGPVSYTHLDVYKRQNLCYYGRYHRERSSECTGNKEFGRSNYWSCGESWSRDHGDSAL